MTKDLNTQGVVLSEGVAKNLIADFSKLASRISQQDICSHMSHNMVEGGETPVEYKTLMLHKYDANGVKVPYNRTFTIQGQDIKLSGTVMVCNGNVNGKKGCGKEIPRVGITAEDIVAWAELGEVLLAGDSVFRAKVESSKNDEMRYGTLFRQATSGFVSNSALGLAAVELKNLMSINQAYKLQGIKDFKDVYSDIASILKPGSVNTECEDFSSSVAKTNTLFKVRDVKMKAGVVAPVQPKVDPSAGLTLQVGATPITGSGLIVE